MGRFDTISIFILFPVVAVVAGGILAALYPPGPRLRSVVQHVAAGVVFAAVAGELLPEMMDIHEPLFVVLGFAAGVTLMMVVRSRTEPGAAVAETEATRGSGLLVVIGIDVAVDGLLVGIGFAAGAQTGVLITVALTLEALFLGLAAASALARAGATRGRVMVVTAGLAALLALAAVVGTVLLGGLSGVALAAVLAFGAAALLYLVTEELLVEAHEVPETPALAATFFAGFLALLVIEMLV